MSVFFHRCISLMHLYTYTHSKRKTKNDKEATFEKNITIRC